jgi:hypothetical protein
LTVKLYPLASRETSSVDWRTMPAYCFTLLFGESARCITYLPLFFSHHQQTEHIGLDQKRDHRTDTSAAGGHAFRYLGLDRPRSRDPLTAHCPHLIPHTNIIPNPHPFPNVSVVLAVVEGGHKAAPSPSSSRCVMAVGSPSSPTTLYRFFSVLVKSFTIFVMP